MTAKQRRVAVYMRVSKVDQDPEAQGLAITRYLESRGWEAERYVDHGVSGAKDKRAELDRLMADVRRGKFSTVLVWKFDRFARSLRHLVDVLEEFRAREMDFISVTEAIDTSTPMGKLVYQILGAIAEFERELIRERVLMGLAKARASGKRLGRAPVTVDLVRARSLLERYSHRAAARILGVSRRTLGRALHR